MGLADRQYMRDRNGGAMAVPVWLAILILNVIIFLAQYSRGVQSDDAFQHYGALSLDGLKHGMVWQFLTFQFLHGGKTHLLFNMIALWSFGRPVEMMLGKRKFLRLYLVSGFIGGL